MKKLILLIISIISVSCLYGCSTLELNNIQNEAVIYYKDKYNESNIKIIKTKYITERDPKFGKSIDKNNVYIITDKCTIYAFRDSKEKDWKFEDDKQVTEVINILHDELDSYYKSLGYNFEIKELNTTRRGFKQLYTKDKNVVEFLEQENAEISLEVNVSKSSKEGIEQFILDTDNMMNLESNVYIFYIDDIKLKESLKSNFTNNEIIDNCTIYRKRKDWKKFKYNIDKQRWEETY